MSTATASQHQPLQSPISPRPKRHIRAPSNISRLQPHYESQGQGHARPPSTPSTPTPGAGVAVPTRRGLRPLSMSTFNLPTSPSVRSADGGSLSSKQEKADRRRSMIIAPSISTSAVTDDLPPPSGSKLKRLSLVARPPSLELDRPSSHSDPNTQDTHHTHAQPLARRLSTSPLPHQPCTPGSAASRRPDRRLGVRASISYSPAVGHTYAPRERKGFDNHSHNHGRGDYGYDWSLGSDEEEGYDLDGSEGGKKADDGQEAGDQRTSTGRQTQTLTEKHADLLTLIAQRERRVNELRQELRHQEASLTHLKSRWTSIVSRSALSPTHASNFPPPAQTPSHPPIAGSTQTARPRPRPVSMISSTTSASSLSLATIDEPSTSTSAGALILPSGGLSTTGAAVLSGIMAQTEGYLGPEVVEGGKRFLGTLWRTVGAAAGGTVPDHPSDRDHVAERRERARRNEFQQGRQAGIEDNDGNEGEWTQFGPKLDLTNIQRMITPWNNSSTAPLSGARSALTPTSTSTSLSSPPGLQGSVRRERKESGSTATAGSRNATPTLSPEHSPEMEHSGYADHPMAMAISGRMVPSLPRANLRTNLPESNGFDLLPTPSSGEVDLDKRIDVTRRVKANASERERESALTPKKKSVEERRDDGEGEGEGWGW